MIDIAKTYQTKSGHKVRLRKTDENGKFPVHGEINIGGSWRAAEWTQEGHALHSSNDLIEVNEGKATVMWQPIETAPKDGTDVLIYERFSKWAKWVGKDEYDFYIQIGCYRDGDWYIHAHAPPWGNDPTHWMPLPEPPKEGL